MSTSWIVYLVIAGAMVLAGVMGTALSPREYTSERERRNWARCAWLAPVWPGVVGWFVSKWLGMFVAFMWRTAWSKGGRDV